MRSLIIITMLFYSTFSYAQQRKIIDVHFHTRSAGDYGVNPPPNPMTGKMPNAATNASILQTNHLLLKKHNVVKAICSGTLKRNADFIAQDRDRYISSLEFPDHQNNPLPDTASFRKLILEKSSLFLVSSDYSMKEKHLMNHNMNLIWLYASAIAYRLPYIPV
jgi:hypothetical protein